MFRFIHCADLHLDSPFRGVAGDSPTLGKLLVRAQFDAFERVASLAIGEKVDAVVIAGDAFDTVEQSLAAKLQFERQLARLDEAGIRTFYVCGNHDPLPAARNLRLPPGCHRFGPDPETVPVEKDGVLLATVTGVSYPAADVRENLARRFPPPPPGVPAVAVLHCNAGNNADHLPYAPASIDDLTGGAFTYWALGHVHRRLVLREQRPAIVYPGCLQGTEIRETGAHGCALVTLDDAGRTEIDWRDTDLVRYCQEQLDLSDCELEQDAAAAIFDAARNCGLRQEGRQAILRLTLTGRPACGEKLRQPEKSAELTATVREQLDAEKIAVWLERLIPAMTPAYDLERLAAGDDFPAELVRRAGELAAHPEKLPADLLADWDKLLRRPEVAGILEAPGETDAAAIVQTALLRLLDRLNPGDAE